jgi:enamine deaminase RidA (YjgF/YER057c/UK114 family)
MYISRRNTLSEIVRGDINKEWAHSGYVIAGDFIFLSYCVGNVGGSFEEQVNGALDYIEYLRGFFINKL